MSSLGARVRYHTRGGGIAWKVLPALVVTLFVLGSAHAVLAGVATRLSIAVPDVAIAGRALSVSVTALDASGNVDPGYTGSLRLTSLDRAATLPADAMLTNGAGTFSVMFRTAGPHTISGTAVGGGAIAGASGPIVVSAATVDHLRIGAPAADVADTAVDFTVTALDRFDNVATGYAGPVRFTSTDGLATLPATSTLTAGVGVFSATLRTAGPQTVTGTDVDDSAVTGTSGAVAVSAAAAVRLEIAAPGSAIAGDAVAFTVTALDAFRNTATGHDGVVRFASTDRAATLPASVSLANGVGTFSATLETAGAQTLTASDVGRGSVTGTSGPIAVTAAATTHFRIGVSGSATAGTPIDFTVVALDYFGNTVTDHAGVVRLQSSDALVVLPLESSLTSGAGTFQATLRTAGSQILTVTDSFDASVGGISDPIVVSAAAAAGFSMAVPAFVTAGAPFPFTVAALDRFNNAATDYAGTVRVTSSDELGTVASDVTLTNGVGVLSATLRTAGIQTLTVSDTDDPSIVLAGPPVTVSAAATTRFRIGMPPAPPTGVPFTFRVTALDEYDNVATGYDGMVYFISTDARASLPAKSTLTKGEGVFSATMNTPGPRSITVADASNAAVAGTRDAFDPAPEGVPTLDTLAFALLAILLAAAALRTIHPRRSP